MSIRELHRGSRLTRRESVLIGSLALPGELEIPANTIGIVVMAEDGGSSQRSAQNLFVAQVLRSYGLGTLLFDLLTELEMHDRHPVLDDIPLLGTRVTEALFWLGQRNELAGIPIGLMGTRTGAAAALLAAACEPERVGAVVVRGGRPDLAGAHLARVRAPSLLIVGSEDFEGLEFNRSALRAMSCTKKLAVVPGATYLFEAPGTFDVAAGLAGHWFEQHLPPKEPP